jgi:hypothetical protein
LQQHNIHTTTNDHNTTPSPNHQNDQQSSSTQQPSSGNGGGNYSKDFLDFQELRSMVLVIVLTIAIHILPVERFCGRYIAFDSIPHSSILFKAIVIGTLFYVIRKYI